MKILCTWKLLRTTRRIRIRSSFIRHTPLAYRTHNFPPSVHLSENAKHRGYFPGCFPPSSVSPIPALAHPWHRILPCYILWCYCLLCYLFVSPSLLLFGRLRYRDRPRDHWCFVVRLRLRFRRFLSSAEPPGKPPLITRYRLLSSILFALE